MIKSIIFDMDGTLYQTEKILDLSLNDTFDHLRSIDQWQGGTPLELYKELMGTPLEIVWEALLPNHSTNMRKESNDYFHIKLIEYIKLGKGELMPNVVEIFNYLRDEGISIFIASNGLVDYVNTIVNYYNLDHWVTEAFSIEAIESLEKSDLVKHIIDKYHIKINETVLVGDRISDIKAAKKNNIISIGCNFFFSKQHELSQGDYIINDLIELKTLIPKL